MNKHRRNVWVVRSGKKFSIVEEGRKRPLVARTSQREAITIARLIAKVNRSELLVQSRAGRIRMKDSHGFDAFPPRG